MPDDSHPAKENDEAASEKPSRAVNSRLFRKYATLLILIISTALITSGVQEIWHTYHEYRAWLVRLQQTQAKSAAQQISQFLREIEGQIGWTTQLPWSAAPISQRRFDALRLLRQVPAITEFAQVDGDGREKLRVSRLAIDVLASGIDISKEPKFTEAMANKVYYGPVYFRRDSEPYMTLALAGTRKQAGVAIAEVNLKFIWDVISKIRVGKKGYAYVVGDRGRLIAHPDISLVLRKTDVSNLSQFRQAVLQPNGLGPTTLTEAADLQGKQVISAFSKVNRLGWYVFVELPRSEALSPLYDSLIRSIVYLAIALLVAILAGAWLMTRITRPIEAIRYGAARIGAGDFDQRINVRTGDELETLADQFNEMAGKLEQSYTHLENTVEMRTRQLVQSVKELEALGETAQVVNEDLDINSTLQKVLQQAVRLSHSTEGYLYLINELTGEPEQSARWSETGNVEKSDAATIDKTLLGIAHTAITASDIIRTQLPFVDPSSAGTEKMTRHSIAAPLRRGDKVIGCAVLIRHEAGDFDEVDVRLLRAGSETSAMAIQNALLFHELEEKSRQLELVSEHKSQFLANMSHELRTPLNAILGYQELLADGLYGEMPEKALDVIERIRINGHHLLGLINDVLDLSKIEAGQFELEIGPFEIADLVTGVIASTESLAATKNIGLFSSNSLDKLTAQGDVRRLTQALLNLVGNALKFTDEGEVEIVAQSNNDTYQISVRDTGPGISAPDQVEIFEEFHQVDNTITKTKTGSGLGLAIARKIVEMHQGTISVESEVGKGSMFTMKLPLQFEADREAA